MSDSVTKQIKNMILLLIIRMDKYQSPLKVSGKNERLVFNSFPLNMVFRFSYFDELNRIQLQITTT